MFLLNPTTISHMCYLLSLNNIPHGIALHLRRICDTNEKFNSKAIEYKNYLIARDYKPSIVSKHFAHVLSLSREQAQLKSLQLY